MKISRLLELHRQFQDAGLPDSLGDGYLVKHNSIFRNIRRSCLELGYRFSSERHGAYEALPLLQLENLLTQRTFPYTDNVTVLENLTPSQRAVLYWDDLDGNLKRNFVFHEGCHGVVREVVGKHLDPLEKKSSDIYVLQRQVLRTLFEESFANTCEFLAVSAAEDNAHRIFFDLSSYVTEHETRSQLKKAFQEIGYDVVFKVMVLSYLHSNFLRENIDERCFERIFSVSAKSSLSVPQKKTLRSLSKTAFYLSQRFREQTTAFHLRLRGIETPIHELFSFDFLGLLLGEPGLENTLNELIKRTSD